ncbi:WD40 repeat-like protein [Daedalea quercina L-15889]|uniref:WD40 repeat-like protein n=1 Tax=Daedalea quercina L-15889 TaxID=1314783 RepID=A0A165Q5P8_9APHY|nr:WD40 repeat-like protein [Daedalea quercina L-15889]
MPQTSNSESATLFRSEAELILQESRKRKAERTKTLGSPIETPGKALGIEIRGNEAWIAENTTVARVVDLETGKTVHLFRGHTAPLTCLAFFTGNFTPGSGDVMVTGSWDNTIKLWNTDTKALISSTDAHSDFVKALLVIPSLRLLVSSSSDKIVRLWDISTYDDGKPLRSVGSISAHTRPVEAMTFRTISDRSIVLYTADTMGIIRVWDVSQDTQSARCQIVQQEELNYHRTGINEMLYGEGQLWTASTDETVQVRLHPAPASPAKPIPPITHPAAVKAILPLSLTFLGEPYLLTGAGDIIRVYDVSTLEEPELIREVDAHWHDVIALRLWMRTTPVEGAEGKLQVEPWIVSTSLDGTIRKWRLSELLAPPLPASKVTTPKPEPKATPDVPPSDGYQMSEEEERELAELMGED